MACDNPMPKAEWDAFIADLHAKLADGRSVQEARERIKIRRWQRKHYPTIEDQDSKDDAEAGVYS
jgi:hypothetical protein